jgi:hypothetical protein
MSQPLNILVGCEESQAVTIELRKRGHNAYSCDLLPCSGGHPEWHIQGDIFKAIENTGIRTFTENFTPYAVPRWDIGIFFPTCTYLTISANKWYKDQPPRASGALVGAARRQARSEATEFFMKLYNCAIPQVALENPVGIMSSVFRKPDQVLQPWMFGHGETKATCLCEACRSSRRQTS